MSFFYDLNKRLNGLRADDKQINEDVAKAKAKAEVKSPARVSLEESLAGDLKSLMEGAKMADKDYDGDGKVETGKAEVMGSRMKAAAKAGNLEELSPNTLKSYAKKAANSTANLGAKLGKQQADADEVDRYTNRHFPKGVDQFGQRDAMRKAAGADYDDMNKTRSKAAKRVAGIGRAVDRLANEDDMGEGNEFSGELVKAKAMGKKEFEVDGKEYKVKEDGTGGMNFSGSGSLEEAETKSYSAKKAAAGKDIGKPGKNFEKIEKSAGGGEKGKRIAGAVLAKLRAAKESIQEADDELAADKIEAASKKDFKGIKKVVMKRRHEKELDEAGLPDIVDKKAKMDIAKGKKPGSMKNVMRGLKAFVKGTAEPMDESDDEMIGYLQKKAGSMPYNAGSGKPDAHNGMMFETDAEESPNYQQIAKALNGLYAMLERDTTMAAEEVLGHVAEAKAIWEGDEGSFAEGAYYNPGLEALAAKKRAEREAKQKQTDEGYGEMDAFLKDREKQKGTGKFDSRKVSTGTVYTRKPETFDADDEGDMPAVARGRGRPAVAKKPERVTKGAWKRKEVEEHGSGVENMKGKSWQSSKAGAHPWNEDEEINEKAEAGKREFFDKLAPAAKKVARVVNKMTKGKEKEVDEAKPVAKKPAADKEQSAKIPEVGLTKVNAKGVEQKKKVKETTTAGSVATAPASNTTGDSSVGKGIYDSYNRDVEKLISESFTVNMSKTITDNGQNQSNINISATDEDADMLKELLLNAGIDISGKKEESCCPACGATPCACGGDVEVDPVADGFAVGVISAPDEMGHNGHMEFELDEADAPVTQNSPDYPTNQEYSNDSLQYSGGLNKPKSTGQTTTPVIASQLKRQMSEADSFLNLYQSFKAIK
jgi:hypothetical protein